MARPNFYILCVCVCFVAIKMFAALLLFSLMMHTFRLSRIDLTFFFLMLLLWP